LVSSTSNPSNVLFPNPVVDRLFIQFNLEKASLVLAEIYDAGGKKVADLVQAQAKSGLNEIQFNLDPLAQGLYFLRLSADGKEFLTERFVKSDFGN
jgi:hypothetical protein